ncbi:DUF5676 family membrane protein [Hyphomicrobium sp. 2TAF46]|uniref:DUF5676 family membrane protein n=1 Tax=Hyphomicrobium sp. 2TAF46 TaxID=3233019 RepID=UPI003F8FE247
MDKLNTLSVGIASAVTMALASVLCAMAFAFWPDATLDFFGTFMHGLDLNVLKSTTPIGLGRAHYGAAGLGIIGFILGVVFASIYNFVSRR